MNVLRVAMPVVVGASMVLDAVARGTWLASWVVALPVIVLAAVVVGGGHRSRSRYIAFGVISASFAVWMLYEDRWRIDDFHLRLALWTCAEALIVLAFIATRLARWSFVPALALAIEAFYYFMSIYSGVVGDRRLMWFVFAIAVVLANAARLDQPTSAGAGDAARTGTVV